MKSTKKKEFLLLILEIIFIGLSLYCKSLFYLIIGQLICVCIFWIHKNK